MLKIADQSKWNFFQIISTLEDDIAILKYDDISFLCDALYDFLQSIAGSDYKRESLQSSFRAFLASQGGHYGALDGIYAGRTLWNN